MKTIKVNLGPRSYPILIGSGILGRCGRIARSLYIGTDAYIITNPYIRKKYGAGLASSLRSAGISVRFKLIADTEKSKSLATVSAVLNDLAGFDMKKRIFIIAFGGGVVGDLAGFVAAIYKRGIPYIQVPTTLLAQVDSSIGGKTAVDLDQGKNLAGAFYQPRAVISDISLLKSLDKRQLRQGLSEVIKYGLIRNRQLFSYVEKNMNRILGADTSALSFIVQACSSIKAAVVSADEKEEKSIRTALNFGHTIGHAIEAGSGYSKYGHGEAVALGMLVAADISVHMKMLDKGSFERIRRVIASAGLPVKLRGVSFQKIISLHYRDKKFRAGKNRFVLLESIGTSSIVDNVSLLIIKKGSDPIIC